MLISHHFHGCKAPLARASHVKWRYTKYLGFSFFSFNALNDCGLHGYFRGFNYLDLSVHQLLLLLYYSAHMAGFRLH